MTTRTARREHFPDSIRVQLLEDDVDSLQAEIESLNGRISRLLVVSAGILVSTTTGTIMLALNLLVK